MKEIIVYLLNPKERITGDRTFLEFVYTICLLLLSGFVGFILMYVVRQSNDFELVNAQENPGMPLWFIILVPPLLEEIAFRLSLRRKKLFVFISLSTIFWFIFSKLISGAIYCSEYFLMRFTVSIITGAIVTILTWSKVQSIKYSTYFYAFAIFFGMTHLMNYSIFSSSPICCLFFAVVVLTKTFDGAIYGFIRIRYNFYIAVFIHAFHNLPLVLLAYS